MHDKKYMIVLKKGLQRIGLNYVNLRIISKKLIQLLQSEDCFRDRWKSIVYSLPIESSELNLGQFLALDRLWLCAAVMVATA